MSLRLQKLCIFFARPPFATDPSSSETVFFFALSRAGAKI